MTYRPFGAVLHGLAGPLRSIVPASMMETTMTYSTTFPDFVLDVAIPQGFEDVSYVNDVCPSWMNETLRLQLFIDYADRERREFPESPRFTLVRLKPDDVEIEADIIHTDDYAALLKAIETQKSRVLTQSQARKIFAKHLDRALAEIQRLVDEKAGDLAGQYVDATDEIVASTEFTMRAYLKAQCIEKGWRYDEFG